MSVIVCPSGLTLDLRGLQGKELKIFQDKTAKRAGRTYDNILTACTEAIVTPGPAYIFPPDAKAPEWDKVLVGDKFYALLAIRAETFGDYEFKFKCRACEEMVSWGVKLPDGMPIKKLAPEDAAAFVSGTPLEVTLKDGKVAKYRLAVGADERASAAHVNEDDAVLAGLTRRVVSIEGVTSPKAYLETAGLRDIASIVKAFEAHDCGVETEIEVQCTKCHEVQEMRLPLGRSFWMPVK